MKTTRTPTSLLRHACVLFLLGSLACAGGSARMPVRSEVAQRQEPADVRSTSGPPCEPPDHVPTIMNRTDHNLYRMHEDFKSGASTGGYTHVTADIHFCGELSSILELGLTPNPGLIIPGVWSVILPLADLPRIVQHPGVVMVTVGEEPTLDGADRSPAE